MRITLVRVRAWPQLDPPAGLPLEGDGGGFVEPRSLEVEIVEPGLVLDLDRVRAGLDRLQVAGPVLDLDRVTGADLTSQSGAALRTRDGCRDERGGQERERKQKASQHEIPFRSTAVRKEYGPLKGPDF